LFVSGKYVVLFFYPLDFTFVCPTEIIAFSDRADEFRQIGCEVIACSTDSHFSHHAWLVVIPTCLSVYAILMNRLLLTNHFFSLFEIFISVSFFTKAFLESSFRSEKSVAKLQVY